MSLAYEWGLALLMKAFFLGGPEPGEKEVRENLKGFFLKVSIALLAWCHIISSFQLITERVLFSLQG